MSVVEFWEGHSYDVDLDAIASSAVTVKGKSYRRPSRFLEIYGNLAPASASRRPALRGLPHPEVKRRFLPRLNGLSLPFGGDVYQPPFVWNDCHPDALAVNFTYNTNAIYRILGHLADENFFAPSRVDGLLDMACLVLSDVYRSGGHEIIRSINNNLNMFLISKVIETILGKDVYDSEVQELRRSMGALNLALALANEHADLPARQQMALALGKGIAFVESYMGTAGRAAEAAGEAREVSNRYVESPLAVDHRDHLIERIARTDESGVPLRLCAILDDTVETVDDLLWMQSLLKRHRRLQVELLVNTAQISINFSSHMLAAVLRARPFSWLASRMGEQVFVTRTYCPLISFQDNFLDPRARRAVARADLVYVKGLNFFETCQLVEKDVFHAFVVYGPISRRYTGLRDFDGVFAYVPAGKTGYRHHRDPASIQTLHAIVEPAPA